MFTPVNPSYTTYKWGLLGVKIVQACFCDAMFTNNHGNEHSIEDSGIVQE